MAGTIHGAVAGICGTILVALALQLGRSSEADKHLSPVRVSILYLFVLFAAFLASNGKRSMLIQFSARDARIAARIADGSAEAQSRPRPVRSARSSISVRADEA